MNIYENHEDDQSVLSEIILQNKNKFVLDIYSNVFSSSFPWDPSSTELYGGCYYEKDSSTREGNVRNKIFKTNPFFLHFPGKHFSCYDKVIRHAWMYITTLRATTVDYLTTSEMRWYKLVRILFWIVRKSVNDILGWGL